VDRINHLQKRIKYGLTSAAAITLHEIGFADRVVAGDLVKTLGLTTGNRARLRRTMQDRANEVEQVLQQFPAYYLFVWQSVLRGGRRRF